MGIDGIGKRGGVAGIHGPSASPVGAAKGAGESFASHLDRAGGAQAAERAGEAQATSLQQQLKAGQIDLNQYLDQKVERATQHLSALPPAALAEVKRLLRDELASDPGLRDLVQQATGQLPAADGE